MKAAVIAMAATLCLFAEVSREGYRNAYKVWRLADPNLERDAATGGLQLEPRAQKVAADAAQYEAARKLFVQQLGQESERKFAWLDSAPPEPPAPLSSGTLAFLAAESKTVQHSIDTFAGDPDPGIRQLRGMLQREGAALKALTNAIGDRDKTAANASAATAALEQTRNRVLEDAHAVASGWAGAVTQTDRESAAWAEYYKLLADGAQNIAPPTRQLPTPTAAASVPETTARVMTPAPATAASPATRLENDDGAKPSAPVESRLPLNPSITPVPLIRYTGEWIFPATNGLYHGPQPESAALVVNEDNGHASGSLTVRFKQENGLPRDPTVHFHFSGEFENKRNQAFALQSNDGSKGVVELIPGPAFNLIEVNFQIPGKPGKVSQGDMILVKK